MSAVRHCLWIFCGQALQRVPIKIILLYTHARARIYNIIYRHTICVLINLGWFWILDCPWQVTTSGSWRATPGPNRIRCIWLHHNILRDIIEFKCHATSGVAWIRSRRASLYDIILIKHAYNALWRDGVDNRETKKKCL